MKERVISLLPTMNDATIAREVGCSRERVRQIRNEENIANPQYRQVMCTIMTNDDIVPKFLKLNPTEITTKEACEELGISYNSLKKLMDEHGIKAFKRKPYVYKGGCPFKRTKEDWLKLIEIHGNNQTAIAKAEGLSQCRVSAAFKRHGIKANKRGYRGR
jgi:hypothetical protein